MAWSLWRKKVADVAQGGTDPADQHYAVCERLALAMRDTQGGRNLVSLGYDPDIGLCSQLDQFRIIPKLDRQQNCLTAD
jgi:phosphosulfolactate phosphohydrolase-like enzyme